VPGCSGPARRGSSDVARSVLVASWYLKPVIANPASVTASTMRSAFSARTAGAWRTMPERVIDHSGWLSAACTDAAPADRPGQREAPDPPADDQDARRL